MCLKLKNLPKNGRNIHLDTLCRLRKGGSSASRRILYSNSRPNFKIKDIRKRKIDKKLIFMELIQFYSCCLWEIWKSSVVHIQIRPICTTRFVSRVYHLESSSLDLVQHIQLLNRMACEITKVQIVMILNSTVCLRDITQSRPRPRCQNGRKLT